MRHLIKSNSNSCKQDLISNHASRLDWESLIETIATKAQQSLALSTILQTTADAVQQILRCDRIFFYQLGLAISKSLIRLMGGKIWVESLGNIGGNPPENWTSELAQTQGTAFYFTANLKVASETKTIPKKTLSNPQLDVKIDQSQYRILLAEDNLVNQKVAAMMLKKLGYIADIANNGLEVLRMVEMRVYDLILMDMQMPEMDGVTATKIIRQSNQPQPRIIAVTANASAEDRQLCFDAGMNDFVTKPILIQEINRIIAEYSETKYKKK